MWEGISSPVASTGISSYLLKLIPVLRFPKSSSSKRSSGGSGFVQSWLGALDSSQRPLRFSPDL